MADQGLSVPGVSRAEMDAIMPRASTDAPPPVGVNSATGAAAPYARADHTHQSRLQARRVQVTPNAQGQYVYTFPLAYVAGDNPVAAVTAETPPSVTYRNDAAILEGSTTLTQTTVVVTRLNQNIVMGVLNAVLPVFVPVTTPVWINIMSRATS